MTEKAKPKPDDEKLDLAQLEVEMEDAFNAAIMRALGIKNEPKTGGKSDGRSKPAQKSQ